MELKDHEIHIWQTRFTSVDRALEPRYQTLMSAEERERQQRFRFDKGRWHYAITRALVRTTLSYYAQVPSVEWQFIKGEHGKPELKEAPIPLRFNLSHSDHRVVCAVTLSRDIGIDIECTNRSNDILAIADRYFSKREVNDLFALPIGRREDRFFDYWTLKEAYMKARGEGISLGLGNFSFIFNDGLAPENTAKQKVPVNEAIKLKTSQSLKDSPEDWYFRLFSPDANHRMSLAIKLGNAAKRAANRPRSVSITLYDGVPLAGDFTECSLS